MPAENEYGLPDEDLILIMGYRKKLIALLYLIPSSCSANNHLKYNFNEFWVESRVERGKVLPK